MGPNVREMFYSTLRSGSMGQILTVCWGIIESEEFVLGSPTEDAKAVLNALADVYDQASPNELATGPERGAVLRRVARGEDARDIRAALATWFGEAGAKALEPTEKAEKRQRQEDEQRKQAEQRRVANENAARQRAAAEAAARAAEQERRSRRAGYDALAGSGSPQEKAELARLVRERRGAGNCVRCDEPVPSAGWVARHFGKPQCPECLART